MSAEEAARIIRELRDENAKHRTERSKTEAELKKFQDAQLSEADKQARRLADLERANSDKDRELQELKLTRAIERKAAALSIIDPDAAARLLDWSEIDYDEAGAPKNLDKLLTALIQTRPYLVATQAQQRPPASSGGATNPGAGARTGAITLSSYKAMSPQERIARDKEVQAVLRQNGGRLPE